MWVDDIKRISEQVKSKEKFSEISTTQKKEYIPVQKTLQQEIEENNNKQKADNDLQSVLNTIPSSTEIGKQADILTQAIAKDPLLQDSEHKNIVQEFMNSLKSWDISGAFTSLFSFLQWVMWPWQNPESTFWFKDNKEIQDFLERLSKNHDKMSITELENQKNNLINKIDWISGVKRKLWLTYALSRLLDEIIVKKDPNKLWMMWERDWKIANKTPNECAIARMSQQVKPGDIFAVNKSEQQMWDKLLTQLSDDDVDTSHVLIVTAVDPESGKITVAHSTWSKVNSSWKWVETNLDFAQYTNQFNGIAIAALRPPEDISQDLVKNVLAKDGKWYDEWAATSTALLWSNITKNNDKYNCVELIAQSFPDTIYSKRKDWTHPSQMLQTLKPAYVTIAWKSIWWS